MSNPLLEDSIPVGYGQHLRQTPVQVFAEVRKPLAKILWIVETGHRC